MSNSIDFFDSQFCKQVTTGDLELNPFELAALPHLSGRVLDFGCGLGNLAIAAARQGCTVVAIDASPTAVNHITERCASEGLAVTARQADLRRYEITQEYDVIVSIGLLMFFEPESARRQLAEVQNHVRTGGIAVVNVLIEGTTYMDMFDPAGHYLFQRDELREAFASWKILSEQFDDYKAPTNSVKRFVTIIARK